MAHDPDRRPATLEQWQRGLLMDREAWSGANVRSRTADEIKHSSQPERPPPGPIYAVRLRRPARSGLGLSVLLIAASLWLIAVWLAERQGMGWMYWRHDGTPPETRPAPVSPARQAEPPSPAAQDMVRLPGGSFLMGSPTDKPDREGDETQHRVTVADFSIGKYEVTQAQWRSVMGDNPSRFSGCDRCPVEGVRWGDVQDYIARLNRRTGRRYRLPTEEEWEYACRAGGAQNYCGANKVDSVAWYQGNSGLKPHPVGQKRPNAWGLYDMSGNVWEWTGSCYESDCGRRVNRGGSWTNRPGAVRSANRDWSDPTDRNDDLGFRLAHD